MTTTIGDELPAQQRRVRELARRYRDPLLGGAGELAARMMDAALTEAEAAMASGDIARIIAAYRTLVEFGDD